MSEPRYSIGIDLGTTNSAVAAVDLAAEVVEGDPIRNVLVPQLVAPGQVEGKSLLPSSMYFPGGHEMPAGSAGLPWDSQREHVVGILARALGSRNPGRLVHSAKSWLCHPDADRRGPILPWGADAEVPHLSPVQACAEYLDHIREAWNHQQGPSGHPMEQQEVHLTVPASFDAVARQLTLEAAKEAGLANVTLMEEPQAAFYCWISNPASKWREVLGDGRVVLVCDVGGGTTDFTLIVVRRQKGDPVPVRVAVGDHLLLGGDNMDLALGHVLEPRLVGKKKLSAWEWGELTHACRQAKEDMLRKASMESATISILGRSASVVGGALSTKLSREELTSTILEGFFPGCASTDEPSTQAAGLHELGLPYTADPGITRHLAKFLRDSAQAVAEGLGEGAPAISKEDGSLARPDVVLFNGGVFRPTALRERLLDVIGRWFQSDGSWRPVGVTNAAPDLAVARGGAYFGLVQRGHGLRISGGSARSYYLGLGQEGLGQVSRVVCVVPRGMEEGVEQRLAGKRFTLRLGQAVRFPLFASSVRIKDQPGDVLDRETRGLVQLPALRTLLESPGSKEPSLEVELSGRLTETGTLCIDCREADGAQSWTLELELRSSAGRDVVAVELGAVGQRAPDALARARELIIAVYGPKGAAPGQPRDPGGLRARLEEALHAGRDRWIPRTLRSLLGALLEVKAERFRGPVHEARWLNLVGYCARPGFGYPGDETSVAALWPMLGEELRYKREEENHREWWILWRRISGGLSLERQGTLFEAVARHLLPQGPRSRQLAPESERPGVLQEMWRLAASLERIDPSHKVRLGEALLTELSSTKAPPYAFWALARLGSRWPLSGSFAHVIPAATVEVWIGRLSKLLRAHKEKVSFTLAHLARLTGDRGRDVDESLRRDLLSKLQSAGAPERHRQLVGERVELADAEQATLLGDAIPPGLELVE